MLTITFDDARAKLALKDYAWKAPYAMSSALTWTAQRVREEVRAEMLMVFDRPTPYALNSLYVRPARKDLLEALVWFKFGQSGEYLRPQVEGGRRPYKRFEKALYVKGVLPGGMYVVPAKGARLNAYGNMSAGQITQILSALGASTDAAQNRTARSAKRARARGANYFVLKNGEDAVGIAQRKGRQVVPVLAFVREPTYSRRLPFFEIARRVVARDLESNFAQAMRRLHNR